MANSRLEALAGVSEQDATSPQQPSQMETALERLRAQNLKNDAQAIDAADKQPGFFRRLFEKPATEQVQEAYASEKDDSLLTDVGKAGARVITAIPSLAMGAVDEATKQIGDETAKAGDENAPILDRVVAGLKTTAPVVIGKTVKKLLFDPQANMVREGAGELGTAYEAALNGDLETAQKIIPGATARIKLGLTPVVGPMIQGTSDEIEKRKAENNGELRARDVIVPFAELGANTALLGEGLRQVKGKGTENVRQAETPKTEAPVENVQTVQNSQLPVTNEQLPVTERPTFTTGDQPGPNYTSAELKAFKEKNGIADEPVQMVGEAKPELQAIVHGTSSRNIPSILKDGLTAQKLVDGGVANFDPKIYFADQASAIDYAARRVHATSDNAALVFLKPEYTDQLTLGKSPTTGEPFHTSPKSVPPSAIDRIEEWSVKDGQLEKLVKTHNTSAAVREPNLVAPLKNDGAGNGAPPELPQSGSGEPLPKYAGSVNLERLNTSDEVKRVLLDDYKSRQGEIDKVRRNPVSQEQTLAEARELGLDAKKTEKLLKQKPEYAAEVTALREHNVGAWERVKEAQKNYQAKPSAEALIEYQSALSEAAAVHEAVQGRSSEIGRALNAHKIYAEAAKIAKTNPERAIQLLQKELGENWKENSEAILGRIAKLDPNDRAGFNRLIRSYAKFGTGEKIYSYWVANLLSGVGTQVKNITGNTSMVGAETVSRALFAPGEAKASVKGRISGMKEGFEAAMQVLRDGVRSDQATKLDLPKHYEFPGGWKNPWNLPGRTLSAADAIFKTTAMKAELNAQAYRLAKKEGLKGKALQERQVELLQNPTPEMLDAAVKQSKYETFTSDPGDFAKGFLHWREKSIGGVQPLKYVSPFVNVANNILKRQLEYSPAGFLQLIQKNNRANAKQISARAAVGTAVAIYAAEKYADGELTGAAPKDPGERDAFFRQGKQPYSVKVGNRWIRYTDFGPLSFNFMAAAGVGDATNKYKNFPANKVASESIVNIAEAATEQSFLKGIKDMSETLSGESAGKAEATASGLAGGMVPFSGFLRSMRGVVDDKLRDPDDIYERLLNGVPILSKQVPSRLNALGDEQKNSPLNSLFGMGFRDSKDVKNPKIEAQLSKLGVTPRPVGDSFNLNAKAYELNRDQQRELTKLVGQARTQLLEKWFNDEFDVTIGDSDERVTGKFSELNLEQQKDATDNVLRRAYKIAQKEFVKRMNAKGEKPKEKPKKNKLLFVQETE